MRKILNNNQCKGAFSYIKFFMLLNVKLYIDEMISHVQYLWSLIVPDNT